MAVRSIEAGQHSPRHLPTPGEMLEGIAKDVRGTARWIGDHWLLTIGTVGIGGLGVAGYEAWNRFQSDQKPAQVQTIDTPPSSAPVIIYGDTATPEPSATPILDKLDAFIANATREPTPSPFPTITIEPSKTPTTPTETSTPNIPSKPTAEFKREIAGKKVESYNMVTEKNFDNYFVFVDPEKYKQLLKGQNLPAFPFVPASKKFSFGETNLQPQEGQTARSTTIYSDHFFIVSTNGGDLTFFKTAKGFTGTSVLQKKSSSLNNLSNTRCSEDNSKLTPKIDAPIGLAVNTAGKPIEEGVVIAEFYDPAGGYDFGDSSPKEDSLPVRNRCTFTSTDQEKLVTPIVTIRPDGGKVTQPTTTLEITPPLEQNKWVNDGGKIALPKIIVE